MSNEMLEKVIRTTEVGAGGGLLNPEQANTFIDYMWDTTVLASQVRSIRMNSDTIEIEKVKVGQRLMRLATEAVDTGENAEAVFSKISLTTKKLRLDFELSAESLEDNIEGSDLEDHIARLMATAAGNDLEDLAVNGDDTSTDPLLKAFDGWDVRAKADGAHIVDHAGGALNRDAFNKALKAMPRYFMQRRGQLKFFVGSNLIQDYLYSLTNYGPGQAPEEIASAIIQRGPVRTEGAAGFVTSYAFGLPVQEVPAFLETRDGDYDTDPATSGVQLPANTVDHGDLWLTFPKNLLWGVKREIKVVREYKPKKDTIEYTMMCRVGTQIEEVDAFVIVKNIKVQS
jgi:hypothetical protein